MVWVWISPGDDQFGTARVTTSLVPLLNQGDHHCRLLVGNGQPMRERCRREGIAFEEISVSLHEWTRPSCLLKALPAFLNHRAQSKVDARMIRDHLRPATCQALLFQQLPLVPMISYLARILSCPAYWLIPNFIGDGYPLDLNKHLYQWYCQWGGITPLANSRSTAESLGHSWIRPEVLPLGAHPEVFHPDAVPAADALPGVQAGDVVFGIFGRVIPEKGQDRFFEGLLRLHTKVPLHLLVCGGPPDGATARRLKELSHRHGATHRLHLIPETEDPRPYYPHVDIAVNSRITPEPFGLSVVEAMMMKKPVLAHASGGPSEIIVDGQTGWLSPSSDPDAFRMTIKRCLADRPHWHRMGEKARERACRQFDIRQTAQSLTARILRDQKT